MGQKREKIFSISVRDIEASWWLNIGVLKNSFARGRGTAKNNPSNESSVVEK